MGEQKPEKTKKHICAGLLAHVTGRMHSSYVDKEDSEYEYSVSTGKFFLDTGVVEIE